MPKRTVLIGCFSTVLLSLIPHLKHSRCAIFRRFRLYSKAALASSIISHPLSLGSTQKAGSAGGSASCRGTGNAVWGTVCRGPRSFPSLSAGLRPIGIKLSASLSPPKVIEDGLDVSNGDAGDRLASLARDEQ